MTSTAKLLETVDKKEQFIIREEQKILQMQEGLEKLVKKEEKEEKVVATELNFFQRVIISKLKKHKVIFQMLIIFGIVLVWRGLWNLFDTIPFISYSLVSLILGVILLLLLNRITDLS